MKISFPFFSGGNRRTRILFVLTIMSVLAWVAWERYLAWDSLRNAIHIAVAAPMKGPDAALGKSAIRGIGILLDRINAKGGIRGRKIILDVFDDENTKRGAETKALEIAKSSRSVAVIGHTRSSNSIAAGKIYKKYGVPAITPGSSNVNVTKDNPWYFRNIFNDNYQGRFLANYAKKILGHDTVSIIRENQPYGAYLGRTFAETSEELGGTVRYSWEFAVDENSDAAIRRITEELKTKKDAGLIFLATHAKEGILLVRLMKDAGIDAPLIAPQTFSNAKFIEGLETLPASLATPGHYTDGIYVTTPLIFDTANEDAQLFRAAYLEKYKEEPDWRAAFNYDSARMITRAIRNTGIQGKMSGIRQDREKIRDWIASVNRPENAIRGVTGLNYFDSQGDCPKPLPIGIFKGGDIVSALVQLQPAGPTRLPDENSRIVIDGKMMRRTAVVYAGIQINDIRETDTEKSECELDLHLWFRYRSGETPQKIVFLNTDQAVDLGKPVAHRENRGITYELYHIRNRFKIDFLPSQNVFGEHIAGISFRHGSLDRNRMIYVTDVVGMGLTDGKNFPASVKNSPMGVAGWKIKGSLFFQDTLAVHTLGDPGHLGQNRCFADYSRFNAIVRISKNEFSLRRLVFAFGEMVSPDIIQYLLIALVTILILLAGVRTGHRKRKESKLRWVATSSFVVSLMVLVEIRLFRFLSPRTDQYGLEITAVLFDVLWWLVPAFLIIRALNPFVWFPLEQQAGRTVPRLMRNIAVFVICLVASFGIVAFVFEQRLTGLLATSGLFAMIIGLAIQMNLSDIFSGIAINLENPFRIGDWVIMEGVGEAKVAEITWRSTRLRTRRNTIVSVPNSKMAESVVENCHSPDDHYFLGAGVHVDPLHSPEKVMKILKDAVLTAGLDSPFAIFKGMTEWSAKYWVEGTARDFGMKSRMTSALWSNVKRHLETAGMNPIITRQEIRWAEENPPKPPSEAGQLIGNMDVFRILTEGARETLGGKAKKRFHSAGKTIIRQGEDADSLFVIAEGVVEVTARLDGDETVKIAKLGVGEFFGEACLTSGERIADVKAVTDATLYELRPDDIRSLGCASPEIVCAFGEVLARREAETTEHLAEQQAEKMVRDGHSEKLGRRLGRLVGFGSWRKR